MLSFPGQFCANSASMGVRGLSWERCRGWHLWTWAVLCRRMRCNRPKTDPALDSRPQVRDLWVVYVAEPHAAPVDTVCPDCWFLEFSLLIIEGFRDSTGWLSFCESLSTLQS